MSEMTPRELRHYRKITCSHLSSAASLLPSEPAEGEDGGVVAGYENLAEKNELEQALDELIDVGYANTVPIGFWQELLAAADHMGLARQVAELTAHIKSFG